MISPELFLFLIELKNNNHKPWFEANNERYQALRKEFLAFSEEMIAKIGAYDEEIVGINPKKTLFRINRDIRFSKNKAPYKSNFGTSISEGKGDSPGYYVHIEPDNCFLAGGCYMPMPEDLAKIRNYIDATGNELRQITENLDFVTEYGVLQGERLKSAPKGYPKDHPEAHFLAMKGFFVAHKVTEEQVCAPDFVEYAANVFKSLQPLNDFLRTAIRK